MRNNPASAGPIARVPSARPWTEADRARDRLRRPKCRAASKARWAKRAQENPLLHKFAIRRAKWHDLCNSNEDDIGAMLVRQKNACVGCAIYIDVLSCTVDHIVAICNGGANNKQNLQLLCLACNVGKHQMDMEEYVAHCKRVAGVHS